MKKIFKLIVILITCALISTIGCGKQANPKRIKITTPFKENILDIKKVLVEGKYTSVSKFLDRPMFIDHDIEDLIADWAKKNGITPIHTYEYYKGGVSNLDMKIIVNIDVGIGVPYTGHFVVLYWHYDKINIKFIDPDNNKLMGEAKYKRPFATRTPSNIIEMMLNKLTKKNNKKI